MFLKEKTIVWCSIQTKMSEQPKVRRKSVNLILIIVAKRAVNNFHHNTRLFTGAILLQELFCLSLTKEVAFFKLNQAQTSPAPAEGQEEEEDLQLYPVLLPLFRGPAPPLLPSPALSHSLFFRYHIFLLKTTELAWTVSEQDAAWTVDWMTES